MMRDRGWRWLGSPQYRGVLSTGRNLDTIKELDLAGLQETTARQPDANKHKPHSHPTMRATIPDDYGVASLTEYVRTRATGHEYGHTRGGHEYGRDRDDGFGWSR